MGRYAFFNTGFEYKFWFGIQSSDDITIFGGFGEQDEGEGWHQWSDEDKPIILHMLREFEEEYELPPRNCDLYEANLKGTQHMYSYLIPSELEKDMPPEEQAYYCLGWIIYHQLLYEPNLTCKYEL